MPRLKRRSRSYRKRSRRSNKQSPRRGKPVQKRSYRTYRSTLQVNEIATLIKSRLNTAIHEKYIEPSQYIGKVFKLYRSNPPYPEGTQVTIQSFQDSKWNCTLVDDTGTRVIVTQFFNEKEEMHPDPWAFKMTIKNIHFEGTCSFHVWPLKEIQLEDFVPKQSSLESPNRGQLGIGALDYNPQDNIDWFVIQLLGAIDVPMEEDEL